MALKALLIEDVNDTILTIGSTEVNKTCANYASISEWDVVEDDNGVEGLVADLATDTSATLIRVADGTTYVLTTVECVNGRPPIRI